MTIEIAILSSVVFIAAASFLGFLLTSYRERFYGAVLGLMAGFGIMFWCWIVAVAYHFIVKYW